jgi:hypothetical protein
MLGIGTAVSIHAAYYNKKIDAAIEKQRIARLKMWELLK